MKAKSFTEYLFLCIGNSFCAFVPMMKNRIKVGAQAEAYMFVRVSDQLYD